MINLSVTPVATARTFALDFGLVTVAAPQYQVSILPPTARPVATGHILQEDGSYILQEDGSKILVES